MATLYGPKINTDSLILNFDPGGPKSYITGSTTVFSPIQPFNHSGSLVNGVGYSTASKGYFIFDAVDDYISATTYTNPSSSVSSKTINVWFRQGERNTASDQNAGLFSIMSASADPQFSIRTNTTSSTVSGSLAALPFIYLDTFTNGPSTQYTISSSFFYDKWYMVTGVEDVANNRLSLYLDGQLVRTGSRSGSAYQYNADRIQIGAEKLSSNRYFKGDVGISSLYNRALSAQEISRLYDFGKDRYLSEPSVYADAWLTFEIPGDVVNTTILDATDNTNSGSWALTGNGLAYIFSGSNFAQNRINKVNNRTVRGNRSITLNPAYGGGINTWFQYNFPASSRVSISMYTRFASTGAYNFVIYGDFGADAIVYNRPLNPDIHYLMGIECRPNTYYRLDILFVGGVGYYRELYNVTGGFVGRSFAANTAATISSFRVGWSNPRNNYGPSGSYNFDNVVIDWTTARFPSLA
jgi:hypothetical protein